MAYATAAPAAAPSKVPMIFLAAPSPASDEAAVVCGTATGSETLLAMLPALDATLGAFDATLGGALETTDGAWDMASEAAGLDAEVRELTTLLLSR